MDWRERKPPLKIQTYEHVCDEIEMREKGATEY
jgi:hypothetical protein